MKILVTGAFTNREDILKRISDLGHEIVFMQNESDELPKGALECEGAICNGLFLHHKIEQFCSLKYIQLISAGFDRVPMDYVKQKGIKIFNARGVYSVPMAEFAVLGVLSIYKQAKTFFGNQELHKWEKQRGIMELFGKTVCIVGCGSVGSECAKRFSAFGCRVLGVDVASFENEYFEKIEPLDRIDEVLINSDIIILTLPLTSETKNLFCEERMERLKQGAVLVNIARGAIVNTEALIKALQNNLGGAVLDVFESEPLPERSPLWDIENVILTPHNSFVGEGNLSRLSKCVINNLIEGA